MCGSQINYFQEKNVTMTCYICESKHLEHHMIEPSEKEGFPIYICRTCGHAGRMEPAGFEHNIKAQLARFEQASQPKSKLPWYHTLQICRRRLEMLKKGNKRIMDLGCNNGQWLMVFDKAWQKFGVELAQSAAAAAQTHAGVDVFCGPFEHYSSGGKRFDVVTALALIEHLDAPEILAQWAFDHLKPGGIFLVMTGDRETVLAEQFGLQWPMYFPDVHVHYFSERSLVKLLEDSGFRLLKREWRYPAYGRTTWQANLWAKTKDMLGWIEKPIGDRLYVYAQKP